MTQDGQVHIWHKCYHCGIHPIVGVRFSCESCPAGPDNDFCSRCYDGYLDGRVSHPDSQTTASLAVPEVHEFVRYEGEPPNSKTKWAEARSSDTATPIVQSGFVVRPEFLSGRYSTFGAYGFVVNTPGQVLVLTALHVLDELIKRRRLDATSRNSHYTGRELPALIEAVRCYDALKRQWMLAELGNAGRMLVLPNARVGEREPFSWRDIAAFRVEPHSQLRAASLAVREPQVGDAVWLVAAMPDNSLTRRGVCVESTAQTLIFRYEEEKKMPLHSSGAPILDGSGAVIGINCGLGRMLGRDFGHANPLRSIRTHVDGALN